MSVVKSGLQGGWRQQDARRRDEGASRLQIAEAMGWPSHTVRGFLAGLAKKRITLEVLERVRQVASNKSGVKGSYSIYRLAAEAEG